MDQSKEETFPLEKWSRRSDPGDLRLDSGQGRDGVWVWGGGGSRGGGGRGPAVPPWPRAAVEEPLIHQVVLTPRPPPDPLSMTTVRRATFKRCVGPVSGVERGPKGGGWEVGGGEIWEDTERLDTSTLVTLAVFDILYLMGINMNHILPFYI